MGLPWECHDQSQETNGRHFVTGRELPFFHKRKNIPKIEQSVKMPWHRISMVVACSYSSAPVNVCIRLRQTVTASWTKALLFPSFFRKKGFVLRSVSEDKTMETLVDVKIRPPNGSPSASRKVSGQVSKEVVLSTANKRKMVRQVRTPLLQSDYSWLQTFPSERSSVTSFD